MLPGMCSETFRVAGARAKTRAPTEADAPHADMSRVKQAAWVAAIAAGKS